MERGRNCNSSQFALLSFSHFDLNQTATAAATKKNQTRNKNKEKTIKHGTWATSAVRPLNLKVKLRHVPPIAAQLVGVAGTFRQSAKCHTLTAFSLIKLVQLPPPSAPRPPFHSPTAMATSKSSSF